MLADAMSEIVKRYKDERAIIQRQREELTEKEHECFKKFLMTCETAHSLSFQGMMGKLFKEELWLEQRNEKSPQMIENQGKLTPSLELKETALLGRSKCVEA